MRKFSFLFLLLLCGCVLFRNSVVPSKVVLLPEDKIYTLKQGTPVELTLDNKSIGNITFSCDMKVVHPSILVSQAEKENVKKLNSPKQINILAGVVVLFFIALNYFYGKSGSFTAILENIKKKFIK